MRYPSFCLRLPTLLCALALLLCTAASPRVYATGPQVDGTTVDSTGISLVIVTHKDSPVSTLAPEQVRALFNGHVRAFPQTSDMVTLIDHPMESDRYRAFYQLLFNSPPERIQRRRAAYLFSGKGILPDTALDDEDVILRLEKNPLAIGYVQAGRVDDRVKVVCRLPPE